MTTPTTIVPANSEIEVLAPSILETSVSLGTYQAVQSLKTGKVQPQHIKSHGGKGGQELLYVSHIQGTKIMNDAFDQFWDFQVLRETVYSDNSAVVAVQLDIHLFTPDGVKFHSRRISELGAREQIKGMPIANVVLGAASRGLLRCMLRAFNYGAELYKNEEEDFTPAVAWRALEDYAKTRKYPVEELVKVMKERGILKEGLVERFFEIYKMIYDLSVTYQREMSEKAEQEKKIKAISDAEAVAKKAIEAAEAARKELAN